MRRPGAMIALALVVTLGLGVVTIQSLQAQTYTVLDNFDESDGAYPYGGLVQATDGNFYKLTGATSVTFNGTAATFTVVSSSEITATVPAGATTGEVKVTTPSRTLTSNVNFRVLP